MAEMVMTVGRPNAYQDDRSAEQTSDIPAFLKRIQDGDEEAASELLCRYEAEVRLVVRRQLPRLLRSRFDSLDFMQSVWGSFFRRVRAGSAPSQFADRRHLVAFLARAAKNKVIDEYRRAASLKHDMHREEPIFGEDQKPRELASGEAGPVDMAEAKEILNQLRDLMPEHRRAVLDLKAEGLSSREVGQRLGVSERTVQRVIEDLRNRLDDDPDLSWAREVSTMLGSESDPSPLTASRIAS